MTIDRNKNKLTIVAAQVLPKDWTYIITITDIYYNNNSNNN
jgi:hypothetical protein